VEVEADRRVVVKPFLAKNSSVQPPHRPQSQAQVGLGPAARGTPRDVSSSGHTTTSGDRQPHHTAVAPHVGPPPVEPPPRRGPPPKGPPPRGPPPTGPPPNGPPPNGPLLTQPAQPVPLIVTAGDELLVEGSTCTDEEARSQASCCLVKLWWVGCGCCCHVADGTALPEPPTEVGSTVEFF
jgi:hypothetical protein